VRKVVASLAVAAVLISTDHAKAADGCEFLLCIAGPWQLLAQCRPTVLEVFRDLARGRPLPACDMSGDGNGAGNHWNTEETCPIFYRQYDAYSGRYASCTFAGRIDVHINGLPWSTVHWDRAGHEGTSTWYGEEARNSLTAEMLDPRYDADAAAWDALHPPVPPDGRVGGN
jgi:hypothetical protein